MFLQYRYTIVYKRTQIIAVWRLAVYDTEYYSIYLLFLYAMLKTKHTKANMVHPIAEM